MALKNTWNEGGPWNWCLTNVKFEEIFFNIIKFIINEIGNIANRIINVTKRKSLFLLILHHSNLTSRNEFVYFFKFASSELWFACVYVNVFMSDVKIKPKQNLEVTKYSEDSLKLRWERLSNTINDKRKKIERVEDWTTDHYTEIVETLQNGSWYFLKYLFC